MPSGGVARCRSEITISGQYRSFQCATTENTENAAIAGHALGTTMRQTISSSLTPSSRAAWMISSG